jgi:uncharacterized protein (DUF2147 family)
MQTRPRLALAAVALAAVLSTPSTAADTPSPEGYWLVKDHGFTVRIRNCGHSFCGELAGLNKGRRPDHLRLDAKNSDPDKRDRPLCGVELFGNFKRASSPGKWEDGWVYNPDDGRTYASEVTFVDENTMRVRGSVLGGLIGKNITLVRHPNPANLCSTPERFAVD